MIIEMSVQKYCLIPIAYGLLVLASCSPDLSDDNIPEGFFPDIEINLLLPQFNSLRNDGGILSIPDKGVRGIFVYRKSATAYLAYERNCSYHPADACATIDIHASNLFMIDSCCGSSFGFDDGIPTGGPAWRPLRRYRSYLDGTSDLRITSESINGM